MAAGLFEIPSVPEAARVVRLEPPGAQYLAAPELLFDAVSEKIP
jgi:hypothetical protein